MIKNIAKALGLNPDANQSGVQTVQNAMQDAKQTYMDTRLGVDPSADYDMSKDSRFQRKRTGLPANGGSGDYHNKISYRYYADIEKARDMDRNDSIAGQLLDRVTTNIVQQGFMLDPKTGDKVLDKELAARWKYETEDPEMCDIAGEMSWHDYELMSCRSMFRDGDCGVFGTGQNKFQFFEAHNIQNDYASDSENCVLGVELNEYRKKLGYYIMLDDLDPNRVQKTQPKFVEAYDPQGMKQFFHMYNPKRTTLSRGVTAFAPVFINSGILEDINFSKLVQQQTVSFFAILRQQAAGQAPLPSATSQYGDTWTEQSPNGGTRIMEGIAPGMEITGGVGETISGFSPNVPNAEYFDQVRMITQLISTSFGVPLAILLLDASMTNFTGWRGAIDEARKGFRNHQLNMIKRLHCPAYKWKVSQWLQRDPAMRAAASKAKVNLFGHKWNPPAWNYIEPLKDAQSDLLRVSNTLTSPRRMHQERGRDHKEIVSETIDDHAFAISKAVKKAKQLTKTLGVEVRWDMLLPTGSPEGLTKTVSESESVSTVEETNAEKV